ncbi:MAG: hypothetical protein ACXWKR_02080, partial [Phenylobacterium sp.]
MIKGPNEVYGESNRRSVLIAGAAFAATAAVAGLASAQAPTPPATAPAGLAAGAGSPKIFQVTDTATGKVQGIANGPVWEFKGIPYGAPTGGKNRWMPPQKAA